MEKEDGRRDERTPRMRLSAERRERFLEVLGQTGNRRAAARAIGVEPRLMDQRRRFDPVFDGQWNEAAEQAHRRLSGAEGPLDCFGGGRLNVIRKGRDGRLQIVNAGAKRWNRAVEDRFFAALAMCGNAAAAARSVGFSESAVWQRRRKWPGFARRMEEALEEAELAIEFRLAFAGNDLGVTQNLEGRPSIASTGPGSASLGANEPDMPSRQPPPASGRGSEFDPDQALRFLRWREEKRRGGGRRGRMPAAPSIDEVTERIIRKVEAIKRHRKD